MVKQNIMRGNVTTCEGIACVE